MLADGILYCDGGSINLVFFHRPCNYLCLFKSSVALEHVLLEKLTSTVAFSPKTLRNSKNQRNHFKTKNMFMFC